MALMAAFALGVSVYAKENDELLLDAARSYVAVMRSNENLPSDMLKKAKAVVVLPSVKKVGLLFGGLGGSGVIAYLDDGELNGAGWVSIGGGGAGLQAGYSDSAVVLFLMRQSFVEDIKSSKLVIKADMIATFAGASASKNGIYGDIYVFSKQSGLFAGASLDAAVISYNGEIAPSSEYAYTELVRSINGY